MYKNRRRLISACLAAMLVMFGMALPSPTRAEVTTNTSVPIAFLDFVPCADGGAGEFVLVSGDLHILITTTVDANGGFHGKTHFQPQGISGFGLSTGARYQATGVQQESFNAPSGGTITDTFVNNFRLIGQGRGNNLLVHQSVHMTTNANGDVTADVFNNSITCR
jgi:hypothetical protein